MQNQWIVVSDAAIARIFSRASAGADLSLVDTLEHAQSRAHEGDLRTGGKGTAPNPTGAGQHQSDPQTTTSEKHADIFAKQVAERLKAGFNDNAFSGLILAADPSFLGRLRAHLGSPLEKAVLKTVDKNWAQHDPAKIQQFLENQLDN